MNEADNLEVVPDPFDCDGDDDRDHDYNPDLEAEFDGSKKKRTVPDYFHVRDSKKITTQQAQAVVYAGDRSSCSTLSEISERYLAS